ncbi:MAG TPA: cysteine--tRNA ligase [bacterium]|nr:cysteine--tRNA ligase [bacterium]
MLRIYNTLTHSEQDFTPIKPGEVGLYTCGPTVYGRAHVGNLRMYVFEDVLKRSLTMLGYKVKHVMNITDVGHLVGDGDAGEDKVEGAAARLGRTAWDIAKDYEAMFVEDIAKMNILSPDFMPRATEHIKEQIELVQKLEEQGFTYQITDGIYFDVEKFAAYGKLSGQSLKDKLAGARVEENTEKHHPADFALWKFSPVDHKRQMEWESPWGTGFPGWHLECSAMARAYLGQPFDIHCGGVDHIAVHHENEIAQSEAAYHEPLANYWMHGEFLLMDNQKMSKSLGNLYVLPEVIERGFDPLALRLYFLSANYRQKLNFSWDALTSAQNTLKKLRQEMKWLARDGKANQGYLVDMKIALEADLNIPKALAVLHEVLRSDLSPVNKGATIIEMDEVFGLGLADWIGKTEETPKEVIQIADQRWQAKLDKDFAKADELRDTLAEAGWKMNDGKDGYELERL